MLEHRRNLSDHLDRQLLQRADPPIVADAMQLLRKKGIACSRVVSVDIDSILYLDKDCRPMTAWLRSEPSAGLTPVITSVWREAGFAAERGYAFDETPKEKS